jgi:hypothetical protein
MHKILAKWPELPPVAVLELLDAHFADARIRDFAVLCLDKFKDEELLDYLLQLVQVRKFQENSQIYYFAFISFYA